MLCNPLGAQALTLTAVPDGAGQIWLDNVQCTGTETRLIDCPANPLGNHNCLHAEDAGVDCSPSSMCVDSTIVTTTTVIISHKELLNQQSIELTK